MALQINTNSGTQFAQNRAWTSSNAKVKTLEKSGDAAVSDNNPATYTEGVAAKIERLETLSSRADFLGLASQMLGRMADLATRAQEADKSQTERDAFQVDFAQMQGALGTQPKLPLSSPFSVAARTDGMGAAVEGRNGGVAAYESDRYMVANTTAIDRVAVGAGITVTTPEAAAQALDLVNIVMFGLPRESTAMEAEISQIKSDLSALEKEITPLIRPHRMDLPPPTFASLGLQALAEQLDSAPSLLLGPAGADPAATRRNAVAISAYNRTSTLVTSHGEVRQPVAPQQASTPSPGDQDSVAAPPVAQVGDAIRTPAPSIGFQTARARLLAGASSGATMGERAALAASATRLTPLAAEGRDRSVDIFGTDAATQQDTGLKISDPGVDRMESLLTASGSGVDANLQADLQRHDDELRAIEANMQPAPSVLVQSGIDLLNQANQVL